ncbi:MAG TPA: DnaD domain protein [Bacillota bacterium]|nr:DnaD domain protein [Bacillota bacterium]
MASSPRIKVKSRTSRGGFAIIYNEIWTDYLPYIGGQGALLYCYLKAIVDGEIPDPCCDEWVESVCRPLGLSVTESHQAWALMQEMGLITYEDECYVLHDAKASPGRAAEFDVERLSAYGAVEELFGRPLSGAEVYQLETLAEEHAEDMIVAAARYAVLAGAFSLPYMKQILLNWKAKGIGSVTEAEEDHRRFSTQKAKKHARSGTKPVKAREVKATEPEVSYDDEEMILRRMMKAAKGEGKRNG